MSATDAEPDAPVPPPSTSEVARQRRETVVRAATELIAERGLHRLSLSEIEKRTGMARGHLLYYFRHKEAILLAVFDRMLEQMIAAARAEATAAGAPQPGTGRAWECVRAGLASILTPTNGRAGPDGELMALIHTFLAQVRHRDDYREKLSAADAGWRGLIAADVATSPGAKGAPPELLASLVMALFQGLTQQLLVNPAAFDRPAMLELLVRLLAPLFGADVPVSPDPAPTPG